MSKTVSGYYAVRFGPGDSSEWIDCEIELNDEQEKAYDRAVMLHMSFEDVPELEDALEDAESYVAEEAEEDLEDMDDPYVSECNGNDPMNPVELNTLVEIRDPYTLHYFGLDGKSEEEINAWNAYDLKEVPTVAEFDPDFEPEDPFEVGYDLMVRFDGDPDCVKFDEKEARETLKILFSEANGDYGVIADYIWRCESLCSGDLQAIAVDVAKEMGVKPYVDMFYPIP